MKLITRDADYALRALCYIAKNKNKVINAGELVNKIKIPRPFLRKILQTLNKKGVLISHKGAGGGFSLAMPGEKILLTDIMSAFQGPLSLNECSFKKKICPNRDSCPLRKKIMKIEKGVLSQLRSIRITDITE